MVAHRLDIQGQRFGKLVVIRYVGNNHKWHSLWECLCDCGNTAIILGRSLKSGQSKGCNKCRKNNPERFSNVKGTRFGHLVVVDDYLEHDANGGRVLGCRCDCGKYRRVRLSSLTSGNTKGCGCCGHRKHGLSGTSAYNKVLGVCRKERKQHLDSEWSPVMELALQAMFSECVNCGDTSNLTTDHVNPLSKGYGLVPGNATRLCRKCNGRKQAKMPEQLSPEFRDKVLKSAEKFRIAWSGGF